MPEYIRTQYQGKEFTATLQAPTKAVLNEMLRGLESYARRYKMDVKVLEKGTDPDGGYRATVTAHNSNPFKWLRRKMEMKGKSYEEKQRLKRYYRREDAIARAEKKRREEERHKEKIARMKREAEMEELKARREKAKAQRRAARRQGRTSSPYRPISKPYRRISKKSRALI